MKILLTGAAGFIGMHVATRLLARGDEVFGIDSLNDYYDVSLKEARLARLSPHQNFHFSRQDVADTEGLRAYFKAHRFDRVLHLAAQAGVRYSLTHPEAYIQANLVGFANILENCRQHEVAHLAYASSSSVYGANTKLPFSVHDEVNHPVSLYAATKKSNELMAHSYSHIFGLPTTGLRFFTVYGPWGRPDMSLWLFTKAILEGRPIDVFNHGKMQRDFTFVEDIADGTIRVLDRVALPNAAFKSDQPDAGSSKAPYRVYNIGNHQPVELMHFIETLEKALGKTAIKNFLPMQAGDVLATYADTETLHEDTGFSPNTPIETGIQKWVAWYRNYFKV